MLRTGIVRRCAATEVLLEALSWQTDAAARIEDSLRKVFESCTLDPAAPAAINMTAIDTACRIIEERYAAPLRTGTLADHVGLHKSHFVRIFHRVTGIAPQTYVRQVRVAKAGELSRTEGIIPALESAHAVSCAMQLAARRPQSERILVNLSGRGDKDVDYVVAHRPWPAQPGIQTRIP